MQHVFEDKEGKWWAMVIGSSIIRSNNRQHFQFEPMFRDGKARRLLCEDLVLDDEVLAHLKTSKTVYDTNFVDNSAVSGRRIS